MTTDAQHDFDARDSELLAWVDSVAVDREANLSATDPLHQFCLTLTKATPRPDDAFKQQLELRLMAQLQQVRVTTPTRKPRLRLATMPLRFRVALLGAMAALTLLVAMIGLYPPARLVAQDSINYLLSYFGFSRRQPVLPVAWEAKAIVVTVAPGAATQQPQGSGCSKRADDQVVCYNYQTFNREEAEKQVSFPIRVPTYLPPGYQRMEVFEIDPDKTIARTMANRVDSVSLCGSPLRFSQRRATPATGSSRAIGEATAKPVTVGNVAGLWLEKVSGGTCSYALKPDAPQQTMTLLDNILTWDSEGIRYTLMADSEVQLGEMLKVAQSLQ